MIEQAGPSRQLFETVNFALMKDFDFLVKIAIFWAFLLFRGWFESRVTAEIKLNYIATEPNLAVTRDANHPQKKQKSPKNGFFDKNIKNFHKSKVDGLKKLTTRACLYHDLMHFRGCPFTKDEILAKSIIRFLKFF